jgi:hypothetical protein
VTIDLGCDVRRVLAAAIVVVLKYYDVAAGEIWRELVAPLERAERIARGDVS